MVWFLNISDAPIPENKYFFYFIAVNAKPTPLDCVINVYTGTVFVTIFSFLLVSAAPLIPLAIEECGNSTPPYFTIDQY
jgi:hypothetical protein